MATANTERWRDAARRLLEDGYEMVERENSIVPFEFHKDGYDALYLFRPIGTAPDRSFVPGVRWFADYEGDGMGRRLAIEYPASEGESIKRKTLRIWVPRPVSTLPRSFSVTDAAEHLGLSVPSIKAAIYQGKTLIPDEYFTSARIILFYEPTLMEWAHGRDVASAVMVEADDMMSLANTTQLVRVVRERLESGEITPEFVSLVAHDRAAGGETLATLAEATVRGTLGEALSMLPRPALLALARFGAAAPVTA